jgi:hypothetical protein
MVRVDYETDHTAVITDGVCSNALWTTIPQADISMCVMSLNYDVACM